MKKRVLVTGASGHIGYHVALQLIEAEHDVLLLIRNENQNVVHLKEKGGKVHVANLFDVSSYNEVLQGVDVLFHIASENTTDVSDEQRVIQNTFELSKKVIDAAIEAKVKTIIYTSSVVVLGRSSNPEILINENDKASFLESPYVKGKFLTEEYCDKIILEKSVDLRRIYPSWVVGKNDLKLTPPHKFIKDYIQKGQAFYFKGGISVAAVQEVAKAHINAWEKGNANEKYIAGGNNISFKDFYTALAKHSGHKAPSVFLPKWFIYLASIAAKIILGKKSPVDPKYVQSVILGYTIPSIDAILSEAVFDARKKIAGMDQLKDKKNADLQNIIYAEDDVLLITGFPGWLGNRMVDVFMNGDTLGNYSLSRKIRLLVQPKFKNFIDLPSNFEVVYGDITDRESLRNALKDVKCVYHLAGVIYPKDIKAFDVINYQGTKNLVDVCIEQGVRRILFMGTDSICGYGRDSKIFPEDAQPTPYKNYGKSKHMAEQYILDKTKEGLIDGTSLRGFWFFGPFMPERNLGFFKMFRWKRQIVFGNGKNLRSISHVDNTIQAFIKAEKTPATYGKWYWIGDKKADYTVDEIYTNIANALGVQYKPLYIPRWMCEMFSVLDNFIGLFGKLNATVHAAGKFHKNIAGEITAAERDFNYKPAIGFEEIKKEIKVLV
ncbi:MAG: NAD-dependent epimerase/dehydratase family protein [Bacteroidetes bacterium]|nr:NAD-dependent epimerase/dehydratase family protein [Bacteroidota bacterium]